MAELLEAIKDKFSRFYRQVIRKELDAGQSGRIIELQWKVYDGPMPHYTVIKQTWGEVDETLDKLLTWFENECSEDDPYKNSARVTTLIRIGKHLQQEVANLSDDNFESIRKCTMQFEENLNSFIRYVHWQLKKYIARSFILASRWERGINDE